MTPDEKYLQPERTESEMLSKLADIHRRRLIAFSDGAGKGLSSRDHLALSAEATTPDDIDVLNEARRMLDGFVATVMDLYVDVWREFGRDRCSVCGMTTKQAEAANYDCAREC